MLVNALTLLPSPTHTHTGENSHTHLPTHLPTHTQEISLTLLQLHFKSKKFHFNPLPLQIDIVEMCISSHSSKPLISILNDIQVDSYPPPYSCYLIHATIFMPPYSCHPIHATLFMPPYSCHPIYALFSISLFCAALCHPHLLALCSYYSYSCVYYIRFILVYIVLEVIVCCMCIAPLSVTKITLVLLGGHLGALC